MKPASRFITQPFFVRAALRLSRGVAPIFMLHRFRDDDAGNNGHNPQILRENLAWLRAERFALLPLSELLDRVASGASLQRTVSFTVDDGYADFSRVAAPIFAEFDCPVTVFLTTGFLDGRCWMWWDRVALALKAMGRDAELTPMVESLKRVNETEKLVRIEALVQQSGAEIPASPCAKYAPLAWDDVRKLARGGVTFGPHTVTHPVLARAADEQSKFEISESWRRVRAEVGDGVVPVFCYPNGEEPDFGAREEAVVASDGMRAAVSTRPGYVSRHEFDANHPAARLRLPRFGYPELATSFVQVASGIERAKLAVRAAIGLGA